MKQTLKLAALALLMAGTMTACVPDTELAGYAWTGSGSYYEDGEQVNTELTMVCTSSNSGTLFLSETYGDEEMGLCLAMPFTYTWDDNQGTATATLEIPDDWKGRNGQAKGTYTFTISMSYTKTEGLIISSSSIEQMFEVPCTSLAMVKKDYAKPTDMTGTRWAMEFDEFVDIPDGGTVTAHYRYELEFVTATSAVLNMVMREEGYDESENEHWNVNYTYADGVGHTSIYFDGENVKGGFYMPNATYMTFSDGINGLDLVKQE